MPTTRPRTPRRRKSSTLSTRPRPLAIGYIRVSTAEQADTGASMDAQRAALTIEAARRGWDLEIVSDAQFVGEEHETAGADRSPAPAGRRRR